MVRNVLKALELHEQALLKQAMPWNWQRQSLEGCSGQAEATDQQTAFQHSLLAGQSRECRHYSRVTPEAGIQGLLTDFFASKEVLYIQTTEGESVTIYSEPEERRGQLIEFYLEHTATQPKRQVIFLSENGVKESQSYTGRVQTSGIASFPINVNISQLRRTDTGLYTSRFINKGSSSNQDVEGSTQLFLYVKGADEDGPCQCSRYTSLLYAISAAVALLSLLLTGFCLMQHSKQRPSSKPPPPMNDIYEVMSIGQQGNLVTQNGQQMATQQEDMNIYATPNLTPVQENQYANPQTLRPSLQTQTSVL
ncbi:hypothetical protein AALO_G00084240 [Alosa alosa]|uniref:Uncharacterized protein n=1 Tax=Alosa alosa TaxID=278164 RepID=A0AAV6H1S1_9TELE|nr:hypothetical protein AALO_G00084240 [Alosa alosa]